MLGNLITAQILLNHLSDIELMIIRGGSGLAFRYGIVKSRQTRDLDIALTHAGYAVTRIYELTGCSWAGFQVNSVKLHPIYAPAGTPSQYVVQEFDIRLSYLGASWLTVNLDIIQLAQFGNSNYRITEVSEELNSIMGYLGLPRINPIPLLDLEAQVAEKLLAFLTTPNRRGRDLYDIWLITTFHLLDLPSIAQHFIQVKRAHQADINVKPITKSPELVNSYLADVADVSAPSIDEPILFCNQVIELIITLLDC
jgi:hypothetical protein